MSLPYVSPAQMADYRQRVLLFAKGAPALECIRSHFIPEKTGLCDLTGRKEQEELFVLANRAGATIKVSPQAMQIIANITEISGADQWYSHLREQKKAHRERLEAEAQKRQEERQAASKVVVRRRKPSQVLKDSSTN